MLMPPNLSYSNKNHHSEAPTQNRCDWHLFVPESAAESCGCRGLKATRSFSPGAGSEAFGTSRAKTLAKWTKHCFSASYINITGGLCILRLNLFLFNQKVNLPFNWYFPWEKNASLVKYRHSDQGRREVNFVWGQFDRDRVFCLIGTLWNT